VHGGVIKLQAFSMIDPVFASAPDIGTPMTTSSASTHPPSREQLLYWLHEASEIEHHLMCCYLYAAFSLKRDDAAWTPVQRSAVAGWRRAITTVALEEMTHLALVGNLMNALGASPNLNRPAFPVDAGPYPEGFVIRLQPFSAATIEHFKFLERPSHEALHDAAGFEPGRRYRRHVPDGG
jgi:Ferritin-like